MICLSNIILIVLIVRYISSVDKFPSSIERCTNEDKKCLATAWTKYIAVAGAKGLPELHVQKLSSYRYDKISIRKGGNGPLNLKLELTDQTIHGMDKFFIDKIIGLDRDPKKVSKFVLLGRCPMVRATGQYKLVGKLLFVPMFGTGHSDISFYNLKFRITAETKTELKDGEEYLVITGVYSTYTSEKNKYKLENLLDNAELSANLNMMINENQDILNPELVEPVSAALSKIFKEIMVPAFNKFPYRSYFLDAEV